MTHTKGKIEVANRWFLLSEGKYIIADVWSGRKDESIANAEHLVKCWNNHDKLVEALEDLIEECDLAEIDNMIIRKAKKVLKEVS